MPRDHPVRKLTGRHRFRDVSHMKLTDIFKSLRSRRLRRDVFRRSSLTHSRSFHPPLADHDASPLQPPSPDLSTSSSLQISCYRSDAVSILSATEEDCSSGMSTSSCSLGRYSPDVERGRHFSPRPVPTFPTSPSMFQLRSASTDVDRLEQHLRGLSLADASPDPVALPKNSSRDILMDVCLDVSLQRTIDPETFSRRAVSDEGAQKPMSSPHGQSVVPMILITSVDAKHAKPLPPSAQRSSRTPFGPSNFIHHPTNVPSNTKTKRATPPDDPFTTLPDGSAYLPDYDLTFRLPSFPTAYSSPTKYAPETPTPMCCDHFGDCRGDLWEILHPPLVANRFSLPPFKLPPLSMDLFNDMSTPLPYE